MNLSRLLSLTFFLISLIFVLESVFFTKLLTYFSTLTSFTNAKLVARPLMLGVLPSISVILAFKSVCLS